MLRKALIGTLAVLALAPAAEAKPFLRMADARSAVLAYAAPLPGGQTSIRSCARHSAVVVICRYTVDQQQPVGGVTWLYHGIAYARLRRGHVRVKDPDLSDEAPEPIDLGGGLRW